MSVILTDSLYRLNIWVIDSAKVFQGKQFMGIIIK